MRQFKETHFSKKASILKKIFLFLLLLLCIVFPYNNVNGEKTISSSNTNKYVVLGGESIGIKLNTGVYVTGMFEITTDNGKEKPWVDSDVRVEDLIIEFNDEKIGSISNLKEEIDELKVGTYELTLKRDNKIINTMIDLFENIKGENTIGLYVKDSVLGVGTLTYYDINHKTFGALGHAAVDSEIVSGELTKSYVKGYVKGTRGSPGEKKAVLDNKNIGKITINNDYGIFGTFNEYLTNYELIEVGKRDNIEKGKAQIITVLEGDKKETFDIDIIETKVQNKENIKGIKFIVTDKELLNKTGGIIQGMSGSPIVQNGKLIGAVSHVLVEDSTVGYGVYSEWMVNYS